MHECADTHCVTGNATKGPWPEHLEVLVVGMGCFWGAERKFWQQEGVWSTQVGYAGGFTRNPTYKQVCSGMTDHTEVVQVVFDPSLVELETMLKRSSGKRSTPPRATARAMMWARSTGRSSLPPARPSWPRPLNPATLCKKGFERWATATSPPRLKRLPSFSMPRTITNSIYTESKWLLWIAWNWRGVLYLSELGTLSPLKLFCT